MEESNQKQPTSVRAINTVGSCSIRTWIFRISSLSEVRKKSHVCVNLRAWHKNQKRFWLGIIFFGSSASISFEIMGFWITQVFLHCGSLFGLNIYMGPTFSCLKPGKTNKHLHVAPRALVEEHNSLFSQRKKKEKKKRLRNLEEKKVRRNHQCDFAQICFFANQKKTNKKNKLCTSFPGAWQNFSLISKDALNLLFCSR